VTKCKGNVLMVGIRSGNDRPSPPAPSLHARTVRLFSLGKGSQPGISERFPYPIEE